MTGVGGIFGVASNRGPAEDPTLLDAIAAPDDAMPADDAILPPDEDAIPPVLNIAYGLLTPHIGFFFFADVDAGQARFDRATGGRCTVCDGENGII